MRDLNIELLKPGTALSSLSSLLSEKESLKRPLKKLQPKKALTPQEMRLNELISETSDYILKNAEHSLTTPFLIKCLALSTDGFTLFFGSSNGNISRYNKIEQKITDDVPLNFGPVYGICLDEEHHRAFICGESRIVRIYRLPRLELEKELLGHEKSVNCLGLGSKKDRLYSASEDGTVREWRLDNYESQIIMTHKGPAKCLAISHDGRFVFSGGRDNLIRVYQLLHNQQILNLKSHSDCIMCLAINESSSLLASGSADTSVIL